MLKTFIIDNKDVYYVNSKISNAALWTFYSSNNSTKILGRDIKPAVFYYCDLHSCFSWLTHHISVSNFTLSLSFHVTGSRFHYSPPCQSVRPAMAWLWWESTVLYLNISWCLPWHGALAASQYSCRGGVTDSEGDLVCMCVCVYASTTWPSAGLPSSCCLFALWPSPELIYLFWRAANTSILSFTLYLTLSCLKRIDSSYQWGASEKRYCYSK